MWRLLPFREKRAGSLLLLTSARAETQLFAPYTNLSVCASPTLPLLPNQPCGPQSNPFAISARTNRTQGLYGKLGLRFEDPKSWIEFGWQPGFVLNSPVGFTFSTGTGQLSCYAYLREQVDLGSPTQQSLYNCLKDNSYSPYIPPPAGQPVAVNAITSSSTVTPIQRTLYQNGIFLNFRAAVPLPFKLLQQDDWYVMENRGNYFLPHAGDVSLETRYFVDWSNSFVVPLAGNLSLVPKIAFFFFENKVDGHPFHAAQTSVALQYWFHWHQGLGFRNAFKYAYAQPNP